MRAWIDRTNDGLSGMPADGISLPPKKGDFGTSRWAGSKVRLHQPRDWAEGACMEFPAGFLHSGFMTADLITLAHLSVWSAMNFPNSADVNDIG